MQTHFPLLERGIVEFPLLIDGYRVLGAIKSNHDLLSYVVLRPGVTEERATRWLIQKLDLVDPPGPKLHLVSEASPPAPQPKRLTVEQLDELYRDASPVARQLWYRKRKKFIEQSRPATTLRLG